MKKRFTIANFLFEVDCPEGFVFPENFLRFETPEAEPAFTYTVTWVEELPAVSGRKIFSRPDIEVLDIEGREVRRMYLTGDELPYGCYEETDEHHAKVLICRRIIPYLTIDTIFNALFALEKQLFRLDGMVLHCAYLKTPEGAVLFSAPSETGKSTQAHLWEQYREGCETVNGDRGLLQRRDGIWYANGWPICGDSKICMNRAYPIRAIVMLAQGPDNRCRRLQAAEAFRLVYGQLTVNRWKQGDTMKAMDLLEQLIRDIPFYYLSCTISEEAVDCLDDCLKRGE